MKSHVWNKMNKQDEIKHEHVGGRLDDSDKFIPK